LLQPLEDERRTVEGRSSAAVASSTPSQSAASTRAVASTENPPSKTLLRHGARVIDGEQIAGHEAVGDRSSGLR